MPAKLSASIRVAVALGLATLVLVGCAGTSGPAGRPSVTELVRGFGQSITAAGAEDFFTPEQLRCVAERLVASDLTDETLRAIVENRETAEPDAVAEVTADATAACLAHGES